jgi:hypothetical protein
MEQTGSAGSAVEPIPYKYLIIPPLWGNARKKAFNPAIPNSKPKNRKTKTENRKFEKNPRESVWGPVGTRATVPYSIAPRTR